MSKIACVICGKTNHKTDYCYVLRKVKNYLSKNNDSMPKLVSALENPFSEELEPFREELAREINWAKCEVEQGEVPDIITAVLQFEELWIEDNDSSTEE